MKVTRGQLIISIATIAIAITLYFVLHRPTVSEKPQIKILKTADDSILKVNSALAKQAAVFAKQNVALDKRKTIEFDSIAYRHQIENNLKDLYNAKINQLKTAIIYNNASMPVLDSFWTAYKPSY